MGARTLAPLSFLRVGTSSVVAGCSGASSAASTGERPSACARTHARATITAEASPVKEQQRETKLCGKRNKAVWPEKQRGYRTEDIRDARRFQGMRGKSGHSGLFERILESFRALLRYD
eukprot:6177477-Pleurochrysis_carterae.AAC.3